MTGSFRSPLAEQAGKLDALHWYLRDGLLLQPALELARSGRVWKGPISEAFLGWLHFTLDGWVRNSLAEGVGLVARALEERAEHEPALVRNPATPLLDPPRRVGHTPGMVPQYGEIGGPGDNRFVVDEMRNLSRVLGSLADEAVPRVARDLRALLDPPVMAVVPGAAPPVNPIPPDAEAATGWPDTWTALSRELRNGAIDLATRADKVAAAEAVEGGPSVAAGFFDGVTSAVSGAARAVADAVTRAGEAAANPRPPGQSAAEARAAGAAAGERFVALARLREQGKCPPYEEVAQFLKDTGRMARDPAYAVGFVSALEGTEISHHGVERDGIEHFFKQAQVCWLTDGDKDADEYARDIAGPLGRMAASASHDPGFSADLRKRLFGPDGSGWYLLSDGVYSTDVTLELADRLINHSDGKTMADEAAGLRLLARNAEAAHRFAAEHADVLADLAGKPQGPDYGGWAAEVPALAGGVLRTALVEYPANLASFPGPWSVDVLVARAEAAKAATEAALATAAAVVKAVAGGERLEPAGRLVLTEYFAANIGVVAAAANDRQRDPEITPSDLAASFKGIMAAAEARVVLLTGANEAVAGWAGGFAAHVGDGLAAGEGDLVALINEKDWISEVFFPAEDLGVLLAQLGAAVRVNVKDEREAAAEVVGILSFVLSQGFGTVATTAGAALGGGVGGLAAAYGSGKLAELAADFIAGADKQLEPSGQADLKEQFIKQVTENLQYTMVCALWADDRVRASLQAGAGPRLLPVSGPPLADGGELIVPPLEDPEGVLRVPAPDEQPARKVFDDWLTLGGGTLAVAAGKAVTATGIGESFTKEIVASLFKEG